MSRPKTALLAPKIVVPALGSAVAKLDPRQMIRNPVMFVVEVVALLTTVLFLRDLATGAGNLGFSFQIILWLWFTLLFANFAEAIAEGRGKAQADTLRATRTTTPQRSCAPRRPRRYEGARPKPPPRGPRDRRGGRRHPLGRRSHRGRRLGQRGRETARSAQLTEVERDRLANSLRLAERLGGEAFTLPGGQKIAEDILAHAQAQNVTQIVIGKSARSRWFELLHGSVVHDLVRLSGGISVHVIAGDSVEADPIPPKTVRTRPAARRTDPMPYGVALLAVVAAFAIVRLIDPLVELKTRSTSSS